jgi:hypothetical protein
MGSKPDIVASTMTLRAAKLLRSVQSVKRKKAEILSDALTVCY